MSMQLRVFFITKLKFILKVDQLNKFFKKRDKLIPIFTDHGFAFKECVGSTHLFYGYSVTK